PARPDASHGPGGVIQRCQSHGLGEPPGGGDGEHDNGAPALARPKADGGRERGLANAAGTTTDDDPGPPVIDELVNHQGRGGTAHAAPCSRSAWASLYSAARSMPSVI